MGNVLCRRDVLVLAALLLCFLGSSMPLRAAETIEPRTIKGPRELKAGEGSLLLSIRHQSPVSETMHLYFAGADNPERRLKFERKVGLGGLRRMLGRQVKLYAVPVGTWRLVSHLAGCDGVLKEGEQCVQTFASSRYPLPSGTYDQGWMSVEVVEQGFTDAGELILEAPLPGSLKLTAMPTLSAMMRMLRFKHRVVPEDDKQVSLAFRPQKPGKVSVGADAVSNITCELPNQKPKMQFIPFVC